MHNLGRIVLAGLIVLVVLAPAPLWYRYQYVEAKRLRVVADGVLYRAGQMTAAGLREAIERYGIRTVINLQHESPDPLLADHWLGQGRVRESELCAQMKVRYVVLKPDVLAEDNRLDQIPPAVEEFLAIIDDRRNQPVLLHCRAGLHRTGRLTAIYRMEYQGWSAGDALREMRANGYGYMAASEADDFVIQFVQNYRRRAERIPPVAPYPRSVWEP
jgi:protein tyrosine phosphatase (PTP) superfamily phosphohydrolase (DUF442 family)